MLGVANVLASAKSLRRDEDGVRNRIAALLRVLQHHPDVLCRRPPGHSILEPLHVGSDLVKLGVDARELRLHAVQEADDDPKALADALHVSQLLVNLHLLLTTLHEQQLFVHGVVLLIHLLLQP